MENVNFDKVKLSQFLSKEENAKKVFNAPEEEALEFLKQNEIEISLADLEFLKLELEKRINHVNNLQDSNLETVSGGKRHITPAYLITAPLKTIAYVVSAIPAAIISGLQDGWNDVRASHISKESYVKKIRGMDADDYRS